MTIRDVAFFLLSSPTRTSSHLYALSDMLAVVQRTVVKSFLSKGLLQKPSQSLQLLRSMCHQTAERNAEIRK